MPSKLKERGRRRGKGREMREEEKCNGIFFERS
jgi:hypothetical protein